MVCLDSLPGQQSDSSNTAILGDELVHVCIASYLRSEVFGCRRKCLGEAAHTAFCRPDSAHLNIRYQHERGRGLPGRSSAIGGVAGKELAQCGIFKVPSKGAPKALKRPQSAQQCQPTQAEVRGHGGEVRPRSSHIDGLESMVERACLLTKGLKTARLSRARKLGDRIHICLRIREEIEAPLVTPDVSAKHLEG